jgi:hypothetical protein
MLFFSIARFGALLTSSSAASTVTWPNPLRVFLIGLHEGSCVRFCYARRFTTAAAKNRWRQSLLSIVKCCNACRRNLITGLTSTTLPRLHILSTCKVGQKLGEAHCPVICSFLQCLSWLLRGRFRNSKSNLWITLYICKLIIVVVCDYSLPACMV